MPKDRKLRPRPYRARETGSENKQRNKPAMATLIPDVAEGGGNSRARQQREPEVATVRIAVVREQEAHHVLLAPTVHHHEAEGRQRVRGRARGDQQRQSQLGCRVGYCCLVLPFFLAFALTVISTVTLAVKNEEVKMKCETVKCVLTSEEDPKVYLADCWLVVGGGGLICLVLATFMLSLLLRMCIAAKL